MVSILEAESKEEFSKITECRVQDTMDTATKKATTIFGISLNEIHEQGLEANSNGVCIQCTRVNSWNGFNNRIEGREPDFPGLTCGGDKNLRESRFGTLVELQEDFKE